MTEIFPGRTNSQGFHLRALDGGGRGDHAQTEHRSSILHDVAGRGRGLAGCLPAGSPCCRRLDRSGRHCQPNGRLFVERGVSTHRNRRRQESDDPKGLREERGGSVLSGNDRSHTGRYTVVVPPGVYNVGLCYVPRRTGVNLPLLTFSSPADHGNGRNGCECRGHGHRPANNQGNSCGLEQLPANGGVSIVFTGEQGSAGKTVLLGADGAYEMMLPDGNYVASLFVTNLTAPVQPAMTAYNLSPIAVAGRAVTADFTVPAMSQVTGRVRMTDSSAVPANTMVTAIAADVPTDFTASSCNAPAGGSTAIADAAGNYTLLLANGRSYNLIVTLPIGTGGAAVYNSGRTIQTLAGNRVEDFLVPTLPATVTISGMLTDSKGQGVPNVPVTISRTRSPGPRVSPSALGQ